MKKIMFNDKYGLTEVVLQGRKTMTRRIIPQLMSDKDFDISEWGINDQGKAYICLYEGGRPATDIFPAYQPGEVVVVAQSYKDLGYTKEWVEQHISPNPNACWNDPFEKKYPGWNNKMFVCADLMPHQIRITDIKVERLQDISDEDCLKEGILKTFNGYGYKYNGKYGFGYYGFSHIKDAFASLIDKVSGKGTWERNPWVFAYSFELVK